MRCVYYYFSCAQSYEPGLLITLQKGFGEEAPGLQRNLESFFSKYGKVAAVRMRRVDGTKAFKVRFLNMGAVSSYL